MEIFNYLISLIGVVGAWIMTRLHSKVDSLEEKLQRHELDTAKEYVRKADFLSTVNELNAKLDKVDDKIIRMDDKLDKIVEKIVDKHN